MSYSKIATALVVATGVVSLAASAYGDEPATKEGCSQLLREVNTALDKQQPGATYDAANQEKTKGGNYCTIGYYKVGMAHYHAALKIVGGSATSLN